MLATRSLVLARRAAVAPVAAALGPAPGGKARARAARATRGPLGRPKVGQGLRGCVPPKPAPVVETGTPKAVAVARVAIVRSPARAARSPGIIALVRARAEGASPVGTGQTPTPVGPAAPITRATLTRGRGAAAIAETERS